MSYKKDKVETVKLDIKNYGKTEMTKFDGSKNCSNLILFKEDFEFYATMAEWDEQTKTSRLFMCLAGPAFRLARKCGTTQVLNTTTNVVEAVYNTKTIFDVLVKRYCNTGMYAELYKDFLQSRIRDHQSIEDYDSFITERCDTIDGLARNGMGTEVQEEIKQMVFIDGIPQHIAKQIKLEKVKGYDACLARALEVAAATNWKPFKKRGTGYKPHPQKDKPVDLPKKGTQQQSTDQHKPRQNRIFPPCDYCSKTNHSSDRCYKRQKK